MISVAIQNHPARADLADRLKADIGGDVELVVDPDPENTLPSPWRTYRHALDTTPEWASHRLILQDDATVCDGFRAAAEAAIAAQPDRIVVFFVGGNPREHARAVLNACWLDRPYAELDHNRWLPVVATSWPAHLIRPLLDFVDEQHWGPKMRADDEVVGRFLRARRITPLATVPSLVQHSDTVPSMVGRRAAGGADRGRVAACWVGDCDDCDAAAIDWSIGP